ncbi:hypothetical protein DBR42_08335 [Pelomonas sp. HMWF004]|nr:hypothetical protein DBR42_08335 [Pelomonas sp. HMWF004]
METLIGFVKSVRTATEVAGDKHGTSTTHVATFLVNSTPVRLQMPEAMLIRDGDEIAVAGRRKDGVFNAAAYRNSTNGALGKGAVGMYYLLGCIFSAVGLATLFMFIGALFIAVGLWMIWHARYLSLAYAAVVAVTASQAGVDVDPRSRTTQ